jgi:hypothetical protein
MRSNRVDPVHPEGVEVAEAISNAAIVFAEAYGAKQQKDSRIHYALAKNEVMALDLQVRQGLKERQDFENFDEAYQTEFTTGYDEIRSRHDRLTGEDAALFSSEVDLIRERGRAAVSEFAKGLEVDQGRADTETALQQFTEFAHMTEGEERNGYILQGLETIKAAEEEGWFTEQESEELGQIFTTTLATDSLGNMEPEARLEEIQLAILWREKRGAPLSAEDAANDLGSGSIGDYVPLHVLRKMESQTEDEIELENVQGMATEANASAWGMYPDKLDDRQRRQHIRETLSDNPAAMKEALSLNATEQAARANEEVIERSEYSRSLTNSLYETDGRAQLDTGMLSKLNRTEQKAVRDLQKRLLEGNEWAESTDWEAWEAWDQMTDAQKAATSFDINTDPQNEEEAKQGYYETTGALGEPVLIPWKAIVSVDRARYMSADRADAEKRLQAGGAADHVGSLSQEQLLDRALIDSPFFDRKPTAAKSDDDIRGDWMRISDRYNRRLVELHDAGVVIDDTKRYEVIADIMVKEVSVRQTGPDEETLFAALQRGEFEEGYIPLKKEITIVPGEPKVSLAGAYMRIPERYGGSPTGQNEYVHDWIKKRIASTHAEPVEDVDTDEIEEVWFYLVTQGWDAAESRINRKQGF